MQIVRTNSKNPNFRELVNLLDHELAIRDGADHSFYAQFNKLDSIRNVVVVHIEDVPVGCGAFKKFADQTAEIKRMFVRPEHRGRGIAGVILRELEDWAFRLGFTAAVLETGYKQPEAIRLYEKSNYKVIPNYGPYRDVKTSVCMKKSFCAETN
jgi:GNAT superfamily N-acetyltransferase